MRKDYRYALERGSKKHGCPQCGKKTCVRYVDKETNSYLPIEYGRCDRETNCGYHLNPYKDGYAKAVWKRENGNTTGCYAHRRRPMPPPPPPTENEPVFFDFDAFKQTLASYDKNTFIQNLLSSVPFPFPVEDVTKIIELYRLGTVSYTGNYDGAITFPFIDANGNIRAIQVKKFDTNNRTTHTTFLHSILKSRLARNAEPLPVWLSAYDNQEKKITCLFGAHLLSQYPNNPVALVEAPKTAVYATLYFGLPETDTDRIWLAVYNKSSLTFDKLKVLEGRYVHVFPDLSKDGNTFAEWEAKAKAFESQLPATRFIFYDLMERCAPAADRVEGLDLADYLIKLDWRKFRAGNERTISEPEPPPMPPTAEPAQNTYTDIEIISAADAVPCEIFGTEPLHAPEPTAELEPPTLEQITERVDRLLSDEKIAFSYVVSGIVGKRKVYRFLDFVNERLWRLQTGNGLVGDEWADLLDVINQTENYERRERFVKQGKGRYVDGEFCGIWCERNQNYYPF